MSGLLLLLESWLVSAEKGWGGADWRWRPGGGRVDERRMWMSAALALVAGARKGW